MELPSPLVLELLGAACIAFGGAAGYLTPGSPATGRATASAVHGIGALLGAAGLALHARASEVSSLSLAALPIGQLSVALDGLSALFLIPILLISTLGSLYAASYWRDREQASGPRLRLAWGVMTAAMMLVVLARDAILFLVAWEVMAVAAFFLICAEDERSEVRQAAWVYLVATHLGTLCLLGFFALLARATGSLDLWPILRSAESAWFQGALFALGIAGFGLKAGLMPLHVWLPGAHANAPSHVSALLSGVMLKAGVYGLVRVCGLLPEPPLWWGGTLLGIGVVSGVLGIALAVAQEDLKRLLAYSSIENVGIIAIGVGLAALGRSLGRSDLVALGLGGALLHVLNHSLFKALLFFCAGSVLHATGTRRLSLLGGLARTMPWTSRLFALGALAICGLPPLNGFASELFLYVGLLRTAALDPASRWSWVSMLAPALALIGALAVAGFIKVLGLAFSGTPRSPAAEHAHDPERGMLAAMTPLALACVVLGLLPSIALPVLQRALWAWDPALEGAGLSLATLVPLDLVSGFGLALVALVALVALLVRERSPARACVVTWDCGYARPTPRMQYSDASFAETLIGLFSWAVQARREPPELTGPFPTPTRFRSEVPDAVLDRMLLPALGVAERILARARVLQRGPIHRYLLYVFLTVVTLLMVAR